MAGRVVAEEEKYESGAREADGGCEKAFGCGVKHAWLLCVPRAVPLSSSSSSRSSSSSASADVAEGGARRGIEFASLKGMVSSSLDEVRIRSDSLPLSSYSSWLLPSPAVASVW